MPKYAANTSVSVEKSRAEIESTLERYGANQFAYARDDDRGMAMIEFCANDRRIRFVLTLPNKHDDKFKWGGRRGRGGRQRRSDQATLAAWEQACRQRWRALALCIKAKLEAVEAEISAFEDEFLAHIVLPNDQTAGQWLRPEIAKAYLSEEMPKSFLALPAPANAN